MSEEGTGPDGAVAPRTRRPSNRWLSCVAASLVLGLGASAALVWRSTEAAFTATTSNPASSWTSAHVSITDNDSGATTFGVTNMIPGDYLTRCITVQYTGNLASQIKMYVSASGGSATVAGDLDLIIESGTGTDGTLTNTCTGGGTISWSTAWTGTLQDLDGYTSWASPAPLSPAWSPSGPEYRAYRIAYTFRPKSVGLPGAAAATATMTWEARNT